MKLLRIVLCLLIAVCMSSAAVSEASAQEAGAQAAGPANCKECKYVSWQVGYACELGLASGYNYCYVDPNVNWNCHYGPETCGSQVGATIDGAATPTTGAKTFSVALASGVRALVTCTGAVIERQYVASEIAKVRKESQVVSL